MKRINSKGLAHHLMILVIVVLAVIGAAGYFVWQRQNNKDIKAKAAGYDYQYTVELGMGGAFSDPAAGILACSQKIGTTNSYNVNTKLFSGYGAVTGYLKVGGKVIQTTAVSNTGYVYGTKLLSGATTVEFDGTWSNNTKSFIKKSFVVSSLIPCNQSSITSAYKYKLYASTEDVSASLPIASRNVAVIACKIASGAKGFKLSTKYISKIGYPYNVGVSTYPDNSYISISGSGGITDAVWFGWPETIVPSGKTISISGDYFMQDGTTKALSTVAAPITIESVPNCI